jgi:hypothetical protein
MSVFVCSPGPTAAGIGPHLGLSTARRFVMATEPQDRVYVRVKDGAGNDFICPLDALKKPNQASDEELENCVDDATVKRYSGNIKIKE